MNFKQHRITYLTAGAAGMFCGSCLNDNAVAKELIVRGHEAILVPVYTPIRTDDEDVSVDQVFLGGVNVYLQQKLPFLRHLPTWVDSFLNHPKLISRATKNAGKTSPKLLGELSVSMLQGIHGRQRKEFLRLLHWLKAEVQPDVVVFTNLLIAGFVPELKRQTKSKVIVTLQGDDIFLESLPAKYQSRALESMASLVQYVDCFVVHSSDYAERMQKLLAIPSAKLRVIPLGIPTSEFGPQVSIAERKATEPFTIGYLARMAPEKGLHRLVDAFIRVTRQPNTSHVRLKVAGWMGPQHHEFWATQKQKLAQAGLEGRWEYVGAIDRKEKAEFLRSIDLFCVPTVYQEPKGLFLLEAVASGVPYLQPNHGAFTELHERFQSHAKGQVCTGELFELSLTQKVQSAIEPTASENLFSGTSAQPGDLEEKLRHAIIRSASRYPVPLELMEEIGIEKHADRFLSLINEMTAIEESHS